MMKTLVKNLTILAIALNMTACGNTFSGIDVSGSKNKGNDDVELEPGQTKLPFAQDVTVRALNTYCKSCHALGEMRFIYGEDRADIWNYIFNNRAPISKKLWSEAIAEVLSWPNDTPPDFDTIMDPPERDWMPKGAKRLHMAEDFVNGVSVRQIILDTIATHGKDGGN